MKERWRIVFEHDNLTVYDPEGQPFEMQEFGIDTETHRWFVAADIACAQLIEVMSKDDE